jgi:hypothetical protein
LGSRFGQNGSTWNCGSAFWAEAALAACAKIAAQSHTIIVFMDALPRAAGFSLPTAATG